MNAQELIMLVLGVGVVVVAIAVFLAIRMVQSKTLVTGSAMTEAPPVDPGVEFEWEVKGNPLVKGILFVTMIVALVIGVVVWSMTDMKLVNVSGMIIPILGGGISLFSLAFRKTKYQITYVGLQKFEGEAKQAKVVFTWNNLEWFKPGRFGFQYFLKPDPSNMAAFTARTGMVYCGNHAMLVNSILMARGVPSTRPVKN